RVGHMIEDVRIACGGVAATVIRLPRTEAFLRGAVASLERFEAAELIARDEVAPISDVRGSEQYRRTLAGNILVKFWHDLGDVGGSNGEATEAAPPTRGIREPALARSPEGAQ